MSNAAITKRERKRVAAEARATAERRRRQRRNLQYGLGGVGVVAVLVLVLVVMLSGSSGSSGGSAIEPSASGQIEAGPARSAMLARGDTAPPFSAPGFRMAAGADGKLAVQRERIDWKPGTPTVFSIWAPWCPHCQVELPKLARVMQDYPNVDLMTVVTAIGQEPGPTANGYLADHGLTFPVAVDDKAGTLAQMFGIQYFPTVYFVNGAGTVVQVATGEIAESTLRSVIGSLS